MKDMFQPHTESARSLYAAFHAEAKKRRGRTADEQIAAKRQAVLDEAICQAKKCNLRAPTADEVSQAEVSARLSADYVRQVGPPRGRGYAQTGVTPTSKNRPQSRGIPSGQAALPNIAPALGGMLR